MLKLTANELRFLAEKADGIRDGKAYLVEEDGKPNVVAEGDLGRRQPIIEFETPFRGEGVRAAVKIRLLHEDRVIGEGTDLDKADAVFITQSAVEKFLLPYYMRFWSAAKVGGLENELYNTENVIAAFHIPPSITFGFQQAEVAKVLTRDHQVQSIGG